METESKEAERESVAVVESDGEQRGISKLPQAMKELIFGKLPFQSISVSHIVCKEWNSILSSHSFLFSLPTQNPWLLICSIENDGNWYCMAYCFFTQEWRTISLSFLPNGVGGKRIEGTGSISFRYGSNRDLLSAAQGLLLFQQTTTPQLCVCNPLLRSYAEIEIDVNDKVIRIVQGTNGEPYLVVCSNSEIFSFQIYYYFQDSWRIKFQFAGKTRCRILRHKMVECNGVLFWRGKFPTTIVGYNIREGVVNPVTVSPLPPQLVQDHSVDALSMVAYGSSVLVVWVPEMALWNSGEYPNGLPSQMGIVIWELFQDEEDKLLWKWKEIARIPPNNLPEFPDRWWWREGCVCVGDYLCFSAVLRPKSAKVFAYNLKEGFWQRLPPCKSSYFRRKMISFEPKLIHHCLRNSTE